MSDATPETDRFVIAPRAVDCPGCEDPYHFENETQAKLFIQDHSRYLGHDPEVRGEEA